MRASFAAGNVLLLLVKAAPFHWSDAEFSMWLTTLMAIGVPGMIFWPLVFQWIRDQARDVLLIVFGIFWLAVFNMVLAFSNVSWQLWTCEWSSQHEEFV